MTDRGREVGGAHRTSAAPQSQQMLGVCLMITAMLVIPVADGIAKRLTAAYTPAFVTWVRFLSSALLALPMVAAIHRRPVMSLREVPPHAARTVFLVGSALLYYIAVSTVPLVNALGAYFVAPIVASLLSVAVLREPFDRWKAGALGLGAAGTCLVLRPGVMMSVGMLFALGAGLSQACFLVATRKAALTSPPLITLAFQFVFGAILLAPIALADVHRPTYGDLSLMGLMGAASVGSHLLSINAFRFAHTTTLSPLVYVELVGSTIIGWTLFRDFPTAVTWLGIATIVLGGLCLFEGSRRMARIERRQ